MIKIKDLFLIGFTHKITVDDRTPIIINEACGWSIYQ